MPSASRRIVYGIGLNADQLTTFNTIHSDDIYELVENANSYLEDMGYNGELHLTSATIGKSVMNDREVVAVYGVEFCVFNTFEDASFDRGDEDEQDFDEFRRAFNINVPCKFYCLYDGD
jgi:hypothetical protein